MTKLILTMAAGAAVLLVSCEPLPPYPPSRYPSALRPRPENYGSQSNPDSYRRSDVPDDRYAPRDRPDDRIDPVRQPARDEYPTAERTDNPNRVISPYSPYNVIDVEGFRSGQLAKDPSNGKIFRIP